jgi:hypothetical protein
VIAIPHMLSSHTFVYAAQILRCILFPWFINETREYDLETFKSSKRTRMICPEDIETRKLLRCQQSSTGVFGQSPTEAWISSSWLCLSVTLERGMRGPTSNCRYYSIAFCGVCDPFVDNTKCSFPTPNPIAKKVCVAAVLKS